LIADTAAAPVSKLIFVDSGVPPSSGETPLVPPFFLDHLRTLAVDGVLPPWSAWFGDDTMGDLLPDDDLRSELVHEMPSLPLAYFEQRIPIPTGWDRTPCAYLLLSDAYKESAVEAREHNWPVEEITGAQHLHIAVDPDAVTDALIRLTIA